MPLELTVNDRLLSVPDDQGDMPVLWYLREELKLKGTKYGCGVGQCGACTVHANGAAIRSCLLTLAQAQNMRITTIEGLAPSEAQLHPVQQAWLEVDVPQCGYCQTGQIMAAAALLQQHSNPSDEQIDQSMTNICRCGSYLRIRKAVKAAAHRIAQET